MEPLLHCLKEGRVEAGCDEAGRGCLAGPVFAAAVILPEHFRHEGLTDSKRLTGKQRDELRELIEREALCYAVALCTPEEIDELNILWASVRAMHKALSRLSLLPDHILVDGNRFKPYERTPHTCVVRGDSKYLSIAAASVLAKTHRDEYMRALHEKHPVYDWESNKGYPTRSHREAIKQHGTTRHHRKSFQLHPAQLTVHKS
jgi:ribonuclease HII